MSFIAQTAGVKVSNLAVLGKSFEGIEMLVTILIVVLLLMLVGALPRWQHSRSWGYFPSGGLGLVFVIVIVLLLVGRI
jgi:hypothetical protein